MDQNFDRRLVRPLREHGHDVTVVGVDHPPGLPDHDVLAIAAVEERIVLTNDRDFGELVVSLNYPHAGVMYFRMRPNTVEAKWERLNQVLSEYADSLDRFLVVTESTVRVAQS